jgi:hypothetical protein
MVREELIARFAFKMSMKSLSFVATKGLSYKIFEIPTLSTTTLEYSWFDIT